MSDIAPPRVKEIYEKLEKAHFEVYFVGGCVRNMLMKVAVKDWDLTTNATPEEIIKIFPDSFYDNKFGTVGIPTEKLGVVEITTYRTEQGFSDRRHPEKVAWGKTIEEDLSRRDFTMNAIAMKLGGKQTFVDPFGGQKDIEKKLIRAVGNPKERFKEDALRLLRGVRFACVLGFDIEKETGKEIVNDAPLIKHISQERIRDELFKILASDDPYKGIMLLKNTGLLEFILPELLLGVGVSQARPGRHHTDDVFTHNLLSLKFCPSKDPIVRFAALLHDVGKPEVAGKDKEGLVTFYNHEVTGAKIAYAICERLHLSKKDRERVVNLIRWHMFGVNENQTDSAVRRFIRKIGIENIQDMLDIRIADRLGSGRPADSWRFKLFKQKVEEQLKPAPFSINDLAIDGNDIMKTLSLKPGPQVGKIMQILFEEVDEDLEKNTKEYLLKRAKQINHD